MSNINIKNIKSVAEVGTGRVFERINKDIDIFEYSVADSWKNGKESYSYYEYRNYSESVINTKIADGEMLILERYEDPSEGILNGIIKKIRDSKCTNCQCADCNCDKISQEDYEGKLANDLVSETKDASTEKDTAVNEIANLKADYMYTLDEYLAVVDEYDKLYGKLIEMFNRYTDAYNETKLLSSDEAWLLNIRQLEGMELLKHIINTYNK